MKLFLDRIIIMKDWFNVFVLQNWFRVYQNKCTANQLEDIYHVFIDLIWSISTGLTEIKRANHLPGPLGNTHTQGTIDFRWWGEWVERRHQRSELVALWRVSKERKTRGRQFRRARTQLRITRRNVARNRGWTPSSPANFNREARRPLFSPGRRRHAAASNGLAGGFN